MTVLLYKSGNDGKETHKILVAMFLDYINHFRTIAHGDLPTSIKSGTGHKLHSPKKR